MKTYLIVGKFITQEKEAVRNYLFNTYNYFSDTDISGVWLLGSDKDIHEIKNEMMNYLTGGNFIITEINPSQDSMDGMMNNKFWNWLELN